MPFTITSELPEDLGPIPISARLDLGALIRKAGREGLLDPGSIEVIDLADGSSVPCHLAEEFAHGDEGRVEFPVRDPSHTRYEIRFDTVPPGRRRPHLPTRSRTPAVGAGDLLRHNAGEPRPVTLHSFGLADLDGDGRPDLAGTWNYYYRPGEPRSGVVCHPRVPREGSRLHFGDPVRLRFREPGSGRLQPFPGTYTDAAFGDFDGDGEPELVYSADGGGRLGLYRVAGRDGGGWPVFEPAGELAVPVERTESLAVADLDGDGVLDVLFNGRWIRNLNPGGWPVEPAEAVDLGAGKRIACVDATGDGRLDLVGLRENPSAFTDHPDAESAWPGSTAFWRPRLEGDTPAFAEPRPVHGLPPSTTRIAAAVDGGTSGLLAQHDVWQQLTFFELEPLGDGSLQARAAGRAESVSAVLACSDQSWPCFCDWDGDGTADLLVGGGYGWPRLLRNNGTDEEPAWAAPELILSEDRPVRLLRDEILPGSHWHNMGYPYPCFVDWDGDGRPDLMLPNETNRIFWYRNVGTREAPRFGPRQQLVVDGYPDSEESRAEAARRSADPELPNHPYPADPTSPFFWRTGAAFGDLDGDGLCDLVTHDEERRLTHFVQYDAGDGRRGLRKRDRLRLRDGREIDDSCVGRERHWTESFRLVDWDGDGRLDLIYSTAGSGHVYLLRNVGSPEEPVFAEPRQLRCYGEPLAFTVHGPHAWPFDFGSGRPGLVGCVEWSVYPFFAHAALEMDRHPDWQLGDPS